MNEKSSIVGAVWRGLTTGISILVLAVAALVVAVPAAVDGMPLSVLSGSMRPTYEPGDLVVIKPKEPTDIRIGDVITYQVHSGESELITHRVIEKNSSTDGSVSFITQGDANDVPDATPIRDVQIHGTVWYRIPMLGWVNNWFNGEKRDIVVPTAAGALILYALWNLAVGVRDRRRKKFETHPEVDANPTTAPEEPLADARTGLREP
ncbi:signal peptidase I [Corynebacterium gallinarum]|uniref:signal peptidase I n=1 Tax=Corynebacterium gallinarum TaxID=2762214 RepID=UPI001CD84837|nr:signal peptidase I [Corynebacterium gallinarum]